MVSPTEAGFALITEVTLGWGVGDNAEGNLGHHQKGNKVLVRVALPTVGVFLGQNIKAVSQPTYSSSLYNGAVLSVKKSASRMLKKSRNSSFYIYSMLQR
jgi:hypothetical protein